MKDDGSFIDVLAGNPTRWGQAARRFVRQSNDLDVIGLVETHVPADCLVQEEATSLHNRSHFWSPAVPRDNASTAAGDKWSNHGGVMIAGKPTVGLSTMAGVRGSDGWDEELRIGQCWLAAQTSILSLLLAFVYMDDSIGVNGTKLGTEAVGPAFG